jgi:hypothetical protein
MVRIRSLFLNYLFIVDIISAVIWKMIQEFEPPPWASEDVDEDI